MVSFVPKEIGTPFLNIVSITAMGQAVRLSPSLGSGLIFFLFSEIGRLALRVPFVAAYESIDSYDETGRGLDNGLVRALTLIYKKTYLPSGDHKVKTYARTDWLKSIVEIALVSLAAYKLYGLSSSTVAQGLVVGIHAAAMMILAYAPSFKEIRAYSLKECFDAVFIVNDAPNKLKTQEGAPSTTPAFNRIDRVKAASIKAQTAAAITSNRQDKVKAAHDKAQTAAAVTLLVVSVVGTAVLRSPILANTVAYPMASLARAVAVRCLLPA
jgi:hypothetical protein